MDNQKSKAGSGGNQPAANALPIKMPKNVRQVGNIGTRNKVIYVEDYVMTFIKQLSDREHTGCRVAVLLGFYVRTEEGKNIFVKGAVEMRDVDFSGGVAFTDEGWTSIYESIKKYFTDVEIVGWSLIGPEFFIEGGDKIRKVHMENFSGPDKILLKMDSLEKDEAFYLNENGQLIKQNGYYIYYEKNEEMQNYMVDSKEAVSEERNYNDQATKKIRTVIHEKKEVKDDNRSVIRLLYASSALLAIIVLVIAATLLDNYDKLRSMETAINSISESLRVVKNETDSNTADNMDSANAQSGETVENVADNDKNVSTDDNASGKNNSKDNDEDTQVPDSSQTTADNQETIDVETVSGNIENGDDSDNPSDTEASDNATGSGETDTANNDTATSDTDTAKNDTASSDNDTDNPQKDDDAVPANAEVKYYTVQPGDSLASISFKLYNTFSYMDEIKELNGIQDEDKILAGQKLIVP